MTRREFLKGCASLCALDVFIESFPFLYLLQKANNVKFIHQQILVPGLSEAHANTFIVQLADLHVGAFPDDVTTVPVCYALANRIKTTLLGLGADPLKTIIMHGGDYVCKTKNLGDPETNLDTLKLALEPLARIPAALQLAVDGNHDNRHSQSPEIWQLLTQLGIQPVGQASGTDFFFSHGVLPGVLAATPDFKTNPQFYSSNTWEQVKQGLAEHSRTGLLFWLTHNIQCLDAPLLATLASQGGAALTFSGHTHGGQRQSFMFLNWAIMHAGLVKNGYTSPYVHGDYVPKSGVQVHVTSGLGHSKSHGPRTVQKSMRICQLLAA